VLNRLVPDHVLFYAETAGKVEVVGDVFNSFVVGGELDVNPLLFFPDAMCDALEIPLRWAGLKGYEGMIRPWPGSCQNALLLIQRIFVLVL